MDCPICLESFNTSSKIPLVLECGHSVCKGCLLTLSSSHSYSCPYDRLPISKPFTQLPPNFALKELIKYFTDFNISEKLPKFYASKIPKSQSIKQLSQNCPEHNFIYNSESLIQRNPSCLYCKRNLPQSFWSCEICAIDLCDYCYQDQTASTTKKLPSGLKCESGHNLYYYENSSKFYKRIGKLNGKIECKICKVGWFGSSWGCRICIFELCLLCKAKLSMPLMCDNQHGLVFSEGIIEKYRKLGIERWKCNICSRFFDCESYYCENCGYNMCTSCYEYFTSNIPLDSQCPNNHHIYYSDDQVKLYQARDSIEGFKCSACCRHRSGESYHCRKCEFDICAECFEKIESVKHGIVIKCFKDHELKWTYDFSEFECKHCGKTKLVCGNITCRMCEFWLCLDCAVEYLHP